MQKMWEVEIMKYGTVVRLWEVFGEGEYGSKSFDMFLYKLTVNNIITLKKYNKFLNKFRDEMEEEE